MIDWPQTQFRIQGAKCRLDITQGPVQPGDAHFIPLAKRGSEQIHSSGSIAMRPAFIELPPHLDGILAAGDGNDLNVILGTVAPALLSQPTDLLHDLRITFQTTRDVQPIV